MFIPELQELISVNREDTLGASKGETKIKSSDEEDEIKLGKKMYIFSNNLS